MISSMSGLFCKSNEAHDPAPIEILRSGLFDFILNRRGVVVRTSPKSLFLKIKILSFFNLWIFRLIHSLSFKVTVQVILIITGVDFIR